MLRIQGSEIGRRGEYQKIKFMDNFIYEWVSVIEVLTDPTRFDYYVSFIMSFCHQSVSISTYMPSWICPDKYNNFVVWINIRSCCDKLQLNHSISIINQPNIVSILIIKNKNISWIKSMKMWSVAEGGPTDPHKYVLVWIASYRPRN